MADLMTTIGLDDREFRAGAARVKQTGGRLATELVRGFVGMQTVRTMIRGAMDASREYIKVNGELVGGINEVGDAWDRITSNVGRDLAYTMGEGGALGGALDWLEKQRQDFNRFLIDTTRGAGTYDAIDLERKSGELAIAKRGALRNILEEQQRIREETARTLKDEERLLEISDQRRNRRINEVVGKFAPGVAGELAPQIESLRASAAAAAAAERAARAKENEEKSRTFMERVRDDNLRRSVQVQMEKSEAARLGGSDAEAMALELQARKMQIAADRSRALRDIDASDELDAATKAALRAETEKSFGDLDAATVVGKVVKARSGSSRSLAAGFGDFAAQVFGRGVGGGSGGDPQKQIVRTGQEHLTEARKQTGQLIQIADLLVGVGTLR